MRYLLVTLLFCSLFSQAQNADWQELQSKIDAARTSATGIVLIDRNYTIDKPLVVADYDSAKGDYVFVNLTIQGYATMWDNNTRSRIRATFNDAPILSIHRGKGVIVKGVNFQGAGSNGRESRYSPYAAIAVDPFRYNLPPDGGYPTLQEWYRGKAVVSGSTGIRVEDCTFNNVTVGFITSPNGYTLNAELISLTNIRSYNVKYVIAGCQAQEKQNRVTNLGAWGPTKTVFQFNMFGAGKPGHWIVDGVNIAGSVDHLINRHSAGYFPMYISNVFAESLLSIGEWQTSQSDMLLNSSINLRYLDQVKHLPHSVLSRGGVKIKNTTIRYYGATSPMIFEGKEMSAADFTDVNFDKSRPIFWTNFKPNPVKSRVWIKDQNYIRDGKAYLKLADAKVNDVVVFYEGAYHGAGIIEAIVGDTSVIGMLSPGVYNQKAWFAAIIP